MQAGAREAMEYDVVIVGGGPAGLGAAIRLKQRARQAGRELTVCVLEKGSEIGAHILSGAVMDPRALDELLPDWKQRQAPVDTPVSADHFLFLSERRALALPDWMLPACFRNHGNYVISLGNLVRWLGRQAEELGVEIFAGFAATEILSGPDGQVVGVATGSLGIGRDGQPTAHFQPGVELRARYTLFAEGSRGQLGRQLIADRGLDRGRDPQTYAIGIKELWEVSPAQHQPGRVVHTAGWPLDPDTYGGSFMYHMQDRLVAVGFVVGLGYSNAFLSPFEEFQRFKLHPAVRPTFEGGRRICYGARSITAGGLQSLPSLVFAGGALIGCEAGFLNASRIKGSHAAIKSGMLAADAAFDAIAAGRSHDELEQYPRQFEQSWLHQELRLARNFKPWMDKGLWLGTVMFGIDQVVLRGRAPWTLHRHRPDHAKLHPAAECTPIEYPKPDGKITFDRLTSVYLSNTNHEENQPPHLTLKDPAV
ncbi:MAG TPA: NAD(P)/FAD-dependent oxidoreductase, partial [Burkholderiaceae bacterium]|nr:NAD(P)/FAD-dependent oxidoreductase [Burkholderiaceae bacterium]